MIILASREIFIIMAWAIGDAHRASRQAHSKSSRLQIALSIFMFEAALAGAFFCYATRRGSHALGASTAAALGLITVAAMALFINGWPGLDISFLNPHPNHGVNNPGWSALVKPAVLAVGLVCVMIWSALVARCLSRRTTHQSFLRGAAVCFQLALSAAAAWAFSEFFLLKFASLTERVIIPRQAIFVSLLGGQLCGATLIFAALLGVNQLSRWRELGGDENDDALMRAGRLVCTGVGLRIAWIIASMMIGAWFEPIALRTFFGMRQASTIGMIGARVILGLILPLMYGLLVQASVREHRRHQAAIQFAPIALLVILGELLSAGLTVGMWGLVI